SAWLHPFSARSTRMRFFMSLSPDSSPHHRFASHQPILMSERSTATNAGMPSTLYQMQSMLCTSGRPCQVSLSSRAGLPRDSRRSPAAMRPFAILEARVIPGVGSSHMRSLSIGIILLGAAFGAAAQQPATPACDRACLERYVDRYLEAMLANDPSPELFAIGTRFTENGIQLPLGNEGLWYGMSGIGGYKFYVPDVETQQVAFIGTVRENLANAGVNDGQGNLVALALRLKIANGKIAEVEQLAIRPGDRKSVG